MLGLRHKLSLGFGGLLLIMGIIGVQSVVKLANLGEAVDVILRENYRSVIACEQMKEALERIDSGLLFIIAGHAQEGNGLIREHVPGFEKALEIELNNITVPGEAQKASLVRDLFGRYIDVVRGFQDEAISLEERRRIYFSQLLPLFDRIKETADEILRLNQESMSDANEKARQQAASAREEMYLLLAVGTIIAIGFLLFTSRSVLRPIESLIRSADEIRKGNLDVVVSHGSRDEIGRLSDAFDEMAASLREFRRSARAKLARIQRATQQAFESLPDAVAVIDFDGKVELATRTARENFGLSPETNIRNSALRWLAELGRDVIRNGRATRHEAFQHFVGGDERYYQAEAVPILDRDRQTSGVMLLLHDVTQLKHMNEMKRGLISTVSHQLRTPLTSIRMAIHLLLEEKVGGLTEQQTELLLAAREDSDRLHAILNDLLDISRIESGKARMECAPVDPHAMILDALEPFRTAAQDRGVTLRAEIPDELPDVLADTTRIGHVFGNLLSNALKYTDPGGQVTVSAAVEEGSVLFRVSDTGRGIPADLQPRIFEQFFRVPGQSGETGAGLGLAIAKEIVEAHSGTISVASTEGQGSMFAFTLLRADRGAKTEAWS
jgi:two-component system, NtrC family, sensor histidine kinase KinB